MTTTTDHEMVTKALATLEELRRLDICDPHELTRPFRQFAANLNASGDAGACGRPGQIGAFRRGVKLAGLSLCRRRRRLRDPADLRRLALLAPPGQLAAGLVGTSSAARRRTRDARAKGSLVQLAVWFATALWVGFLIYGAWLCLRDGALQEPEQAPQDDRPAHAGTLIGSGEWR